MTDPTQVVEPQKTETDVQVAEGEVGKDGKEFDAQRAQALIDKLRAENKTAKEAAKELAALKEADARRKEAEMSELEKLQSQLKERDAKLQAVTQREMQRAAGEKYKLPAELTARLIGNTAEEMEADAKKLSEALPAPEKPKLKIDPTNPGNADHAETDAEARARLIPNSFNNIWDRATTRARGGGLVANDKE